MVADTLKDRVFGYAEISDFKLTRKLPVVITLNGRSFRKLTSLLPKPYCKDFTALMGQTAIRLASEIEGATFIYSFNDEINIVCRNDQNLETEAWYDNNIQRICSASASIASVSLLAAAQKENIKLLGDPVFLAKVFVIPSWTEVINFLIAKQHEASHTAISMACFYELLKKYSADKVLKIVKNLTIEDKYDLLTKECEVDLKSFDLAFWRGIACYRTPKLVKTAFGEETKNKLTIDEELPFFNKEQLFLANLLKKQ
jgi:tRNA(His) 5'-end guanylyltransferase